MKCEHYACRCARARELAAMGLTAEAIDVHFEMVTCRQPQPESTLPMTTTDRTLRGVGHEPPPSEPPSPADRTRTLRGLGFQSNTLRGLGDPEPPATPNEESCPGCRAKRDPISHDLACLVGIALVFVQGADPTRAKLCTMHARLLRLLVDEIKLGPKRLGEGSSSWED